ncbi:hypothetical protein A3Q56_05989 [Intoshia linei]|uniref:Uncharacterized protein n=1 Tax=Intoshia linei TaxID=1819745 RepID=A0A177AWC6_9BILA|nr:hypothetical protein A3Q56_05989 [Intoshia linei]
MNLKLWFTDLQNFEPDDETSPELTEKLLNLKEYLKLVRRIKKESVFEFMEIQKSNPIVFMFNQALLLFLQHG